MIELKRCPFCGGKAEFVDFGYQHGMRKFEDWNVWCEDCKMTMCVPGKEPGRMTSQNEAAGYWNRRTNPRRDIGLEIFETLPEEGEILVAFNQFHPNWYMYKMEKGMTVLDFLNEIIWERRRFPVIWEEVTEEQKKLRQEILRDIEGLRARLIQRGEKFTNVSIDEKHQTASFYHLNENNYADVIYDFKLLERLRRNPHLGMSDFYDWIPW